jgi:cobalt-precorrin-6B (C15)-methyltransferase
MALLNVKKGNILLDIGAGTGSISIQAALFGATVYAIEKTPEGSALIRQNAEKFGVDVHVVQGIAPTAIESLPEFTTCFIGGSGGKLEQIIETVSARLSVGGILVANFVRLENFVTCQTLLKTYGFQHLETRLIHTANIDKLGLMRGQNPVGIASAKKQ